MWSKLEGEGKQITVSAKKLAVIFTDTSEISNESINPGWSVYKTFTVENKSGGVFYYDINIDDLINTFVTVGYLQYKITSTDDGYNMTEFVDIPKSSEARRENLAQKIKIEDNEVHTYTIEFKYPNDEQVNQSEDMGEIFSGTLSITESEILVVKYKVNGVIQEEIPSKEIPYIVNNVTCTNNAKASWNEESETVELETPVRQTVCIVEFGDGYTVSMLTEHGEVVNPVSKVVGRIGETTFDIEEKPGYSLSDAKVLCDNGAEGSINNKVITIINIKQNNTCIVTTKEKYRVTMLAENGEIISSNQVEVLSGGTTTFNAKTSLQTISSLSCDKGAMITENNGVITVENINETQICTIKYGLTFTMTSGSCPDRVYGDSGACYIIATNYKDNITATYNEKKYKNCIINSYTMKRDLTERGTNCIEEFTDLNELIWNNSYWDGAYDGRFTYAMCSVTLSCDPV